MRNLLFSLFVLGLPAVQMTAQQTIASQNFESTPPAVPMTYKISSLFTGAGGYGGAYTGMSPVGYYSSNSPYYIDGSKGYGVSNAEQVIDFDPVNTTGYSNIKLSFNLAAFATTSTQGLDATDYVSVFVSTDGANYYEQSQVKGANNAYWEYTAVETASTVYNTTNVPDVFQPGNTAGNHNADGYSTVEITGLPAATTVYVQIKLFNNNNAEIWVVDNVKMTGNSALPVEMSQFSVRNLGSKHLLEWTTAYEHNIASYTIERGKTANEFEQISTLKPMGAGGYSFIDENPFSGTTYYRIKTTDNDGTFSYSAIQSAVNNNIKWRIFPTVVENYIQLEKEGTSEDTPINIFDVTGRNVLSQTVRSNESNFKIDTQELAKGMYFVKIGAHTEKFMKM